MAVVAVVLGCTDPFAIEYGGSFTMEYISPSTQMNVVNASSTDVATSTVEFAYAMRGEGEIPLAVGNSQIDSYITVYSPFVTSPTGERYGWKGGNESFARPDPHIDWAYVPAETQEVSLTYGGFLVRTSRSSRTRIELVQGYNDRGIPGDVRSVDEIVLRSVGQLAPVFGIVNPHFIVTNGTSRERFDLGSNVLFNGSATTSFEYVALLPNDVVPAGFSRIIPPGGIRSPFLNAGELQPEAYNTVTTRDWIEDPDWLSYEADNAALFTMIDDIVGITPSQRASSSEWNLLATRFKQFLIKFGRGQVLVFNEWLSSKPNRSGVLFMSLDVSNGNLAVDNDEVVTVNVDFSDSIFTIDMSGNLNVQGDPPIRFAAGLQKAGQ